MKEFKVLAKEIREEIQKVIMVGAKNDIDTRLKGLMDEFEASIVALADDEAIRRAKIYYQQMDVLLDGEPLFTKDGRSDETSED